MGFPAVLLACGVLPSCLQVCTIDDALLKKLQFHIYVKQTLVVASDSCYTSLIRTVKIAVAQILEAFEVINIILVILCFSLTPGIQDEFGFISNHLRHIDDDLLVSLCTWTELHPDNRVN